MIFWILVALLVGAAIAAIVWPLVGARIGQDPQAADSRQRLAVYRDRREEIEREKRSGRLTEAEARSTEQELLDEVAAGFDEAELAATPSAAARRRPLAAVLVTLLIPLLAVIVYLEVGSPHLSDSAAAGQDPRAEELRERIAQVRGAITEFEARVAQEPDDAEAWAALGAAHKLIGENSEAIPAFERALALHGPHSRLLTDLAEAVALTQDGRFAGRPTELLEQALATNPLDAKANGLMGAAMFQVGDMERARNYLETLLAQLDPGSPQAQQIRDAIARTGTAAAPDSPGDATPPAASSAPALVSGRVEIDPRQRANVPGTAVVFISARAPTGPRIPYAAARHALAGFDGSFALADAQSMVATRKLSDASEVVVEVRISATGNATPASGDLFGVSQAVAPGSPEATSLLVAVDQSVP